MADVYVTPVTGIPVVGHAITLPVPLPVGSAIVQHSTLEDVNGNTLLVNSDGSLTVKVETPAATGSAFVSMPAATANGTPLTAGPTGVEITLPPGSSVTYTIAAAQPTSPPTLVRTNVNVILNQVTPYIADVITLAAGVSVYVTAFTGTPFYRGI